ncbi:MAG: NADH-quinone oxidoreductase subunit H [Spirochaetales bacterium]|nr:NADH-quinone oxidoreductase subunit H [Spirochaetales bacterium]
MIINIIISTAAALVFSPLLIGIINKTKAFFSGRRGSPFFQMYFDLYRLLKKDAVRSGTTTIVFILAPVIVFCCTLAAAVLIPISPGTGIISFTGDFVLLFYLLGLARFFLIISALDTGSSFEGMGASREAFFSAMAEPVVFISILTILRLNGTTSFTDALGGGGAGNWIIISLATVPFFIVMLAENARIPFDDPNTHLELTMIHEVMILDNSGRGLALMEWAASIKLWLFSLIIVRIILPGSVLSFLLTFVIAVIIGIVESVIARTTLLKIPQLLFSAGIIAFLGFFLSFSKIFVWS